MSDNNGTLICIMHFVIWRIPNIYIYIHRYVKANINLKKNKTVENISVFVCEDKCTDLEFPTFILCK